MTNASLDSSRFGVKQPKRKEVKLLYTPGPVAPGITTKLEIECNTSVLGAIVDVVKIETEAETIEIPINAFVVPKTEYSESKTAGKARLISHSAPPTREK